MTKPRLIAFYLPQFHPIPENNEWWGKGFTEWTNVTRAKPLFQGHYQPRLPADLGFYDLRVPEIRAAQAELGRQAGIEGFCYWHYWFAGRRVLERPFHEVLESGEPDYPFCLAWANDTWSGHWYGAGRRTLIEQTYPGRADHERHFHALLPAFHDPRYIRVHNRPLFAIFRPRNLPETESFIDLWNDLARRNGLEGIHFVAHLFDNELDFPWRKTGYGGAVMTNELKVIRRRLWDITRERLRISNDKRDAAAKIRATMEAVTGTGRLVRHRLLQRLLRWPGGVHYYQDAMLFFKSTAALELGCYPSVVPGWDNTARAGRKGIVLHGSTPELFQQHLCEILKSVADRPAEERIVFVKSWNEWAEGNYLEPDQKYGHGYLDAVRAALQTTAGRAKTASKILRCWPMSSVPPKILFIAHDATRTGAPIGLLAFLRWLRVNSDYDFGILLRSPGPLEAELRELGPTVTLGKSILSRTRLGRRLRPHLPRSLQTETRKIQGLFAAGSYDLIYSNTMTNGAILEALSATGVPVITHVHELEYWIRRAGAQNLRQILAHTTAFIAVSQAVRENLIRRHGVPPEKITVVYEHIRELPRVPTAAEKAAARKWFKIPDEAIVVGSCGAEHWRKGRDLIPQLLGALHRHGPERKVHFVWIGRPGKEEEEYALAHDLRAAGVEDFFHQSGEVDDPFRLYPALDVFALLSREDPYPLACLEVAATEIPVVCFENAGGMPEFVRDGCGLVAPYLDVDLMARSIHQLAADPSRSRAFGRRGRAKVARENLLTFTGFELRTVMENIINRNHATASYDKEPGKSDIQQRSDRGTNEHIFNSR